jgi:hypothetical protein
MVLLQLPILLLASVAGPPTTCHRYRGTINGGPQLRPSFRSNSTEQCERACASLPGCHAFIYSPFEVAAAAAAAATAAAATGAQCMVYNQSNIGSGRNMPGTPTEEPSVAACCARCTANPECESWTWACSEWPCPADKTQPCWLHPYGPRPAKPSPAPTWVSGIETSHKRPAMHGGQCELRARLSNGAHADPWSAPGVNSGSGATSGLCGIDDTRFDDPRSLVNSTGDATGVPLGGIGVGFFDYAPDGQIKRVAINNHHADGVLTDTINGTFLALWEGAPGTPLHEQPAEAGVTAAGSSARVLQRLPAAGAAGAAGLGDLAGIATNFTGLFPTARLSVDEGRVVVSAWSSLVPQQIENSSLPLAYFDVTVRNHRDTATAVGVAFSWQEVIARSVFDASAAQLDACYPNQTGPATCALDVNRLMQCIGGWGLEACELDGRARCRDMDRVRYGSRSAARAVMLFALGVKPTHYAPRRRVL